MIRAIRAFLAELMTSSRYSADPVGAAGNQAGHICAGIFLSLFVCLAYLSWFGDMPKRAYVWIGLVVFYGLIIEFFAQNWDNGDSLADTFFFQCGVSIVLWPVREISVEGGTMLAAVNTRLLGVLLAITSLALLAYLFPRIRAWSRLKGRVDG